VSRCSICCLIDVDEASKLDEKERVKLGISKTLPRSVQGALECLLEDKEMVRELGDHFVECYIAVKQVSDIEEVINI
jgi:glutamine synthetase